MARVPRSLQPRVAVDPRSGDPAAAHNPAPDPSPIEQMADMAPVDAPDMTGGAAPHTEGRADLDVMQLGPECPVIPLGVNGLTYYFLDNMRQLLEFSGKLDIGELTKIFGRQIGWLCERYPLLTKDGEPKRGEFNQRKAQQALFIACQDAGIFERHDCERGKGGHRAATGELILHCGDRLLIAGQMAATGRKYAPPFWRDTGLFGDKIFPTSTKLPKPDKKAATRADMWTLLIDHLNSWNWTGPTTVCIDGVQSPDEAVNVHAYLLLCWALMAKLCGAMEHRPSLYVTGPSSAGKSGVHDTLRSFIGQRWHLATKDMTSAWVTQMLQRDRLPVLFDEAEPNNQNTTYYDQILQLAKLAYDGSSKGRGGADGKASTTEIFTAFQFSSVMIPAMKPEDRNRMIILQVDKFPPNMPPYQEPAMVKELGPRALTLLCEQWHRFAPTLAAYRGAMMARNWSAREANTYGTVLAMGDIALFEDIPTADHPRIRHLMDAVQPLLVSSRLEGQDHPELCVDHLVSKHLPSASGQMQETVSQWIVKGVVEAVTMPMRSDVDRKLQSHGLRVTALKSGHDQGNGQGGLIKVDGDNWKDAYVAVAGKSHQGLSDLFRSSTLFSNGGWVKALERMKVKVLDADGNEKGVIPAISNKRARFAGGNAGACVLVPLRAMVDLETCAEAIEEEFRSRTT